MGPAAPEKPRRAIEREKAKAPARALIVTVGEAGPGEAKRQLWANLIRGGGLQDQQGESQKPGDPCPYLLRLLNSGEAKTSYSEIRSEGHPLADFHCRRHISMS